MRRGNLHVVLCLAVLVASTLPASAGAAASRPQWLQQVGVIAGEAIAKPGAAGLSIAVALGDEIILAKGYGLADLEQQSPMTERSMLRIGSVTKQYTAALVMKLIEEGPDGGLSLDDPLTKHIAYPVGDHSVTIRHLLNHTSGIHSYTSVPEFWTMHAAREMTDDELLALVIERPFDFAPGERVAYNNTAYYLLGMVIERVTAMPYAEAVRTMLFEPLGLAETRYDVVAEIVPHRARGYAMEDGSIANAKPIGMRNPGAAGGLMATAADLVRWQQALMSGKVVSRSSFEQMIAPTRTADGATEDYGFGLAVSKMHDRPCISHGGGINGFNSTLMFFPEEQLHIAVISNSEAVSAGRIAMRIAAAALGIEEEPVLDLAVDQALIDRAAGTYLLEAIGLKLALRGRDQRLFAQATAQPEIQLLYQGGGVFRAAFDPSLRIRFADMVKPGNGPAGSFVLEQAGRTFSGTRVAGSE
jgi:D-alanyl-D-alanine carboxypeptidase